MDSNQPKNAKVNLKISPATDIAKTAQNSGHHSAPQQAKTLNLKRRKRRSTLAGW